MLHVLIISAVLAQQVTDGRQFVARLFHRLGIVSVTLAPLSRSLI